MELFQIKTMNYVKTNSATTKPLTHPIIASTVDQSVDPPTKLKTAHSPNQASTDPLLNLSAKQKHISNSTIQSARPNNHLIATSNQRKPTKQLNHVTADVNSLGDQTTNNTKGKNVHLISQQKIPTSNKPKQVATQLKNINTHSPNQNAIPQITNDELHLTQFQGKNPQNIPSLIQSQPVNKCASITPINPNAANHTSSSSDDVSKHSTYSYKALSYPERHIFHSTVSNASKNQSNESTKPIQAAIYPTKEISSGVPDSTNQGNIHFLIRNIIYSMV